MEIYGGVNPPAISLRFLSGFAGRLPARRARKAVYGLIFIFNFFP